MTPSTIKTTPSTTKMTPSTITRTPSTTATLTPSASATKVIIDDNVTKAETSSNYILDSTSPQPIVLDTRESNVKFIQPTLVTFTVGLSKPLDVLLKDVIVYNKVVSNVGDDYNNSTGVFRCNIAGIYYFQIHGAAGEGKELSLSLVKNKTRVISLYSSTNQELSLAANSAVLLLEAGDEVFVEASNCGSLYGEEHHVINTFSGFLLGTSIANA
ncbi:complement C1q-like protein 2 [Physella acuta]|uniref:complement C1q-like protein 2 n=1 Tax=Physella acuta TaxID=109671 RepID=UPI0027DE1AFD|nr:complement C1q-like protein 2 [Physella acuta]